MLGKFKNFIRADEENDNIFENFLILSVLVFFEVFVL